MKLLEAPMVLEAQENCKEIQRILKLRGDRKLEVEDNITETILGYTEETTPGLRLKFLESKKCGEADNSWTEYLALYKMKKWVDTVDYLEYIFISLGKLMSTLKGLDIESVGLQEVECADPGSYYILIYIFK